MDFKSATTTIISLFESSSLSAFIHATLSLSQPSLISPKFSSALSSLSLAVAATATTTSNSSFDFAIADFVPAFTAAAAFNCFGIGLDYRPRIITATTSDFD